MTSTYLRSTAFRILLFGIIILSSNVSLAQNLSKIDELQQLMFSSKTDSLMLQMSENEKIAQLFWLPVFAPGTPSETSTITQLVEDYQPGGLLYFRTDPEKLIDLTAKLQAKSKIPLIVSLDGEWGLGMRLNNTLAFPYQMTLGAIRNDSLLYLMGLDVAHQFKRMGIHVNFAPVVDVNVNPENPVINFRSFGQNPKVVAKMAVCYMNGMQDGGIMAVAKHFPGHGDTNTDSHKTLPLILHDRARLDSVELYPFRAMIKGGVLGVMSGHLEVPALDSVKGTPASISKPILTGLLRDEFQFKGLIITDAMNMNGVKRIGEPGKVDVLALMAGNDIIEYTESLPKAIAETHKALDSSLITWDHLNLKVRRSLALKQLLNVEANRFVSKDSLMSDITNDDSKQLNRLLYQNALTVLSTQNDRLPLKIEPKKRTVTLLVGEDDGFIGSVAKHGDIQTIQLSYKATAQDIKKISKTIKGADNLIVAVTDVKNISNLRKARKTQRAAKFLSELCTKPNVILVFFGNPYLLDAVKNYNKVETILMCYQDNAVVQDVAGNALFGDFGCSGRLPVSIDEILVAGSGSITGGGIQTVKMKYKGIPKFEVPIIRIPQIDKLIYKSNIFSNDSITTSKAQNSTKFQKLKSDLFGKY